RLDDVAGAAEFAHPLIPALQALVALRSAVLGRALDLGDRVDGLQVGDRDHGVHASDLLAWMAMHTACQTGAGHGKRGVGFVFGAWSGRGARETPAGRMGQEIPTRDRRAIPSWDPFAGIDDRMLAFPLVPESAMPSFDIVSEVN